MDTILLILLIFFASNQNCSGKHVYNQPGANYALNKEALLQIWDVADGDTFDRVSFRSVNILKSSTFSSLVGVNESTMSTERDPGYSIETKKAIEEEVDEGSKWIISVFLTTHSMLFACCGAVLLFGLCFVGVKVVNRNSSSPVTFNISNETSIENNVESPIPRRSARLAWIQESRRNNNNNNNNTDC